MDSRASKALLDEELHATALRLAELQTSLDSIIESSRDVALDDEHDPDGSTVAYERAAVAAGIRDAHRRVQELAAARQRVADGSFGICQRCGRNIPTERLRALPAAARCVECAGC